MSLYEQNLQALLQVNTKLATQLFALKTNEKFEVFVDEKDPLNINIASNITGKVLYDGIPIMQTEEYLNSFVKEYQRYPYLYFFGMGNGVFYKALLQNEIHKRVIIVEPEIEILYMALHFNDFTKEIESGRLILLLVNDISFGLVSEIFMQPESRIFSKTYQFHILLPFYDNEYGEYIVAINRIFLQAIEHAVRGLGNDSTDALIGLQHQVANVERMVHTPTTLELIKKVKNSEVAVIVSTGPSLKKQLPLLKKIKDNATLFCIDSSLPILEKEGIKPDVVISIERVIETAKFYQETSKEFQEDIVFLITSIAHPDLFKEIRSGTLQISMRPFGYTSYFEMPEYGYLGIGMSAANMAYELIFHANFKTAVLIGQDLAFGADGSTHSDGHIYGAKEESKNEERRYIVPAYGGEGTVETTLVWKLFKNFFEADIAHANAKGVETINATEGGARITGTIEMPFSEAIEKYIDFNHKKELVVLEKPDIKTVEYNVQKADLKIKHMLSYAIKLQKEVENTFLHVARESEIIENVKEDERYEKLDYQALSDVMDEINHIKEYFDDQEFANIFTDSTQAMILHQEIELAKIQVRNVESDNERRQKMIDWVLAHRYWLFSLAGMMQATIDAVNMGIEMKIDFDTIKVIRVYVDDKEIDVLHVDHTDALINNLFDLKQICINYKLDEKYAGKTDKLKFYYSDESESFKVEIHMPSREDKHYNEFTFNNSLVAAIDKKRIENLYEKDAIGFLAVEENLEDEDFMNYIKELMARFSQVTFKAFYLNQEQKQLIGEVFEKRIETFKLFNIVDLANNSEIFITRNSYQFDMQLYNLILDNFHNIYVVNYEPSIRETLLNDFDNTFANRSIELAEKYGFEVDMKKLKKSNFNKYKYLIILVNEILDHQVIDNFDLYNNFYEYIYFENIANILQNKEIKRLYQFSKKF